MKNVINNTTIKHIVVLANKPMVVAIKQEQDKLFL